MTVDFESRWLADLPEEWVEKRADFLCNPYRVTVDPEMLGDDLVAHYSIPQVQETGGAVVERASDIDSTKLLVGAPTLLVSKLNPRKKTICIASPHPEHITLASSEFVAINSDVIDQRYAFYVWSSEKVTDRLAAIVQSATRSHQRVIPADICKLPWRWPSRETQQRIARFLDEKTAQIEGLIEMKRVLLDRLAEERQALITRAITKGLKSEAPMKPSAIDWLGDIPAHWELVPFKWRCRVQSGQVDPREPEYAEMPLIAPDHIESGTGRLFQVTSAEEQGAISGKYLCPVGSVLYSKIRPALRKVALYDAECLCSADMYAIDPGPHFVREYLFYFLLTDAFTSYAELESLRVAMPKVNREALGVFPLPVPGREEQEKIVEFCKGVDQRHRQLGDQVRSSIDMLERYRTAIITTAVTGRIEDLK